MKRVRYSIDCIWPDVCDVCGKIIADGERFDGYLSGLCEDCTRDPHAREDDDD